ncbi:MAG: cytochrome c biogenesis protein ResB, partial [Bacteroides sp.]|nr:cytochrome c biogenesis protein ResB [Bacteroides sp.]
MKKFLIAVYGCLLLLLAATTFVEQTCSTDFVEKHVYHTIWFCCLWGALAAMTVVVLVRQRLWRCLPTLLLHGSFLVILAGAMTTFLCGRKGYVHLTVGSEVNCFLEQDGRQVVELPFTLRLDSFRIEYYPGTDAPADYISYIHGETPVSMNRILSRQGFRFYQSSFDEDMQGSWLTVNYDPWGIGITYSGYLLLGVSMLWMLVSRGGEFRRLLRHPLLKKGGMFVLLLLCLGSGVHAQKRSLPALARKQADSLARKQVIYNDRVVPFNTLARDFVLKLTGKSSYGGMTPEQVIGGWLLRPEVWQNEPMIYIKNEALRRLLHLETPYACLADLFDGEKYRLQKFWKGKQDHHQKMTSLEKAIVEADEKVGLILMLQNGTLIRPLPEDGSVEPVSDTKIQAELLYNRIPFSKLLFMFNLTVGMLAFFRLLYRGLRRSSALSDSSGRIVALSFSSRLADTFFPFSLYAAFLFQLF